MSELQERLFTAFPQDDILYVDEGHKYFNRKTGEPYLSVSKVKETFCPPFDEAGHSERMSEGDPEKAEALKAEWALTKLEGATRGTKIHTVCEAYELNQPILETDSEVLARLEKFKVLFAGPLSQMKLIAKEFILFNHSLKIAGRADDIFEDNGFLAVGDIKSNKKLTTDWGFGKLYPPFQNDYASDLNKYSLQLCLYELLIRYAGIPTKSGFIIHLPPKDKPGVIYPVRPYLARLKQFLEYELSRSKIPEHLLY